MWTHNHTCFIPRHDFACIFREREGFFLPSRRFAINSISYMSQEKASTKRPGLCGLPLIVIWTFT